MALDTRIASMRVPMNGALNTMAQISNLVAQQNMQPVQLESAKMQNQARARLLAMHQNMDPVQLEAAKLQNEKLKFINQHPLLGVNGTAAQVGAAMYANEQAKNIPQTQAQTQPAQQEQPQQQIQPDTQPDSQPQSVDQTQQDQTAQQDQLEQQSSQNPASLSNKSVDSSNPHGLYDQNSAAGLIMKGIHTAQDLKVARAKYYNQRVTGAHFFNMPADGKSYMLAMAHEMGYPYDEASKLFISGHTLQEMANAKGIDINKVDPTGGYAPTGKTRSSSQSQKQALAGVSALSDHITKALAPYSRQIYGISPKLVFQEIAGLNEDDQSHYLAARAVQPEISSMRIRALNGTVGEKLVEKMQESSVGRLNNFQALVSPEVYQKSLVLLDQWITEAGQKGRKASLNLGDKPVKIAAQQKKKTVQVKAPNSLLLDNIISGRK